MANLAHEKVPVYLTIFFNDKDALAHIFHELKSREWTYIFRLITLQHVFVAGISLLIRIFFRILLFIMINFYLLNDIFI